MIRARLESSGSVEVDDLMFSVLHVDGRYLVSVYAMVFLQNSDVMLKHAVSEWGKCLPVERTDQTV